MKSWSPGSITRYSAHLPQRLVSTTPGQIADK